MTIVKKYYPCTDLLHADELCIVCQNEPLFREIVFRDFKCDCGAINTIEYEMEHGDSLDFSCPKCKAYFKKVIRIRDEQFLNETSGHYQSEDK